MDERTKPFSPGALAKLAGVSTDTLRHYERTGLLPVAPRTASGYRRYAPNSLERVNIVRRALQLGFRLSELAEILSARDRDEAPCIHVLALTEEKLHELSGKIRELRQTERYMQELVRDWHHQLAHCATGEKAMLLHSLNTKPGLPAKPLENLKRRKQL